MVVVVAVVMVVEEEGNSERDRLDVDDFGDWIMHVMRVKNSVSCSVMVCWIDHAQKSNQMCLPATAAPSYCLSLYLHPTPIP